MMYQVGSTFLYLPRLLSDAAKQDAWLSILLAVGLHLLLFVPLLLSISKQVGENSFGRHMESLLGEKVGRVFMLGYIILFPFVYFVISLRALSDFLITTILTETPPEPISVLMLIAIVCAVRSGITTIGRTAEILSVIIIVIFVVTILTLMPSFHFEYFLPVFEFGGKPILHGALLLVGFPYLESVLLLFFAKNMTPTDWKKAVIRSALLSGFAFLGVTFFTIGILGAGVTSNLTMPSYFVTRTITLVDFIERFEVLVSMFFYVTIFFRLTLFLQIVTQGLAEVFRLSDSRILLLPLCLITLAFQKNIWPNVAVSQEGYKIIPFYPVVVGILFSLLIWSIGKFKQRKKSA